MGNVLDNIRNRCYPKLRVLYVKKIHASKNGKYRKYHQVVKGFPFRHYIYLRRMSGCQNISWSLDQLRPPGLTFHGCITNP